MRSLLILILVFGVLIPAASETLAGPQSDSRPTTVLLVRHAEKSAEGSDPGLTEAGEARAMALARMLRVTPIDALYATPFRRTRETLMPLAAMLGKEIQDLPLDREHLADHGQDTAALIRERHPGETVVIAGHSNTVPMIIEALGATPVPVIDDAMYGDLFVVTLRDGSASLLHLRFGD